eukprot:12568697-Alexandrium_andersonii.AAC.1
MHKTVTVGMTGTRMLGPNLFVVASMRWRGIRTCQSETGTTRPFMRELPYRVHTAPAVLNCPDRPFVVHQRHTLVGECARWQIVRHVQARPRNHVNACPVSVTSFPVVLAVTRMLGHGLVVPDDLGFLGCFVVFGGLGRRWYPPAEEAGWLRHCIAAATRHSGRGVGCGFPRTGEERQRTFALRTLIALGLCPVRVICLHESRQASRCHDVD